MAWNPKPSSEDFYAMVSGGGIRGNRFYKDLFAQLLCLNACSNFNMIFRRKNWVLIHSSSLITRDLAKVDKEKL